MKTYISLAGAIYETFKDVIGTKEEIQLHEDVYVKENSEMSLEQRNSEGSMKWMKSIGMMLGENLMS